MSKAQELVKYAVSQIGTKDIWKYNTEYYESKQTYAWCVVFAWYQFKEMGMPDLFYGGGKTASSNTLRNFHRGMGQEVTDGKYQAGDIIFFDTTGKHKSINHTGICESYDGTTMVSIDGNTSGNNGTSDNNGGSVNRRRRAAKTYVMAGFRPNYDIYDREDATVAEYQELRQEIEQLKAKLAPIWNTIEDIPEWGKEAVQDAIDRGILKGVDENKLELSWNDVRSMVFDYRREKSS